MRKTNFFLHFSKPRGLFFRKIFSVFMQLPKGYSTYLKFAINLLSCTQTGATSFLFFFFFLGDVNFVIQTTGENSDHRSLKPSFH